MSSTSAVLGRAAGAQRRPSGKEAWELTTGDWSVNYNHNCKAGRAVHSDGPRLQYSVTASTVFLKIGGESPFKKFKT